MSEEPGERLSRRVGDPWTVQRAFEAMPAAVVLFDGPDLRVAAASAAFRALVGHQEVLGRAPAELLPGPSGRRTAELVRTVLLTGRPVVRRDHRIRVHGSGRELSLVVTADPFRGSAGEVGGVLCTWAEVGAAGWGGPPSDAHAEDPDPRFGDVVASMQSALLPAGLPVLPAVDVAAGYLPAAAGAFSGGDWFDAVPLPDGHLALVVGDVAGHGVEASAAMGRLRSVLWERLAAGADPVAAVSAADVAASAVPGARAATLCLVVLEPATGAVRYLTAGHPPPLVLTPDGTASYLAPTGAGPLGLGGRPDRQRRPGLLATDRIPQAGMVVLYTDGILERPGRRLGRATVELMRSAAAAVTDAARPGGPRPVEALCTRALADLVGVTGHGDDVTLLAAQRRVPPADLALTSVDDPRRLAVIRTRLGRWLTEIGAGSADAHALQHAVGELVVNAMEHAHPDRDESGDQMISVTATLSAAGAVRVEVADRGRWQEPSPRPGHGLGLEIATSLVDRLDLVKGTDGTVASVTRRLLRPARVGPMADPAAGEPDDRDGEQYTMVERPSVLRPRVRVTGAVDAVTVALFEPDLGLAGAAGARPLTVDLAGVSTLGSAGVAALLRLTDEHSRNGGELCLYAPAGSPADLVLTLVGIDHRTEDPDTAARG